MYENPTGPAYENQNIKNRLQMDIWSSKYPKSWNLNKASVEPIF